MSSMGTAERAAELLRALAHPVRLQIVEQLSAHEHRCVHELVERLGVAQPAVSQHLQVLRHADLVLGTRVGKEVRYRLSDQHVAHIVLDSLAHANEGAIAEGAIAESAPVESSPRGRAVE